MGSVREYHNDWQIPFISEVDGRLSNDEDEGNLFAGAHSYRRFWPGPGSKAFVVVVSNAMSPFVRDFTPLGRCIRVRCAEFKVSSQVSKVAQPLFNLALVFIHGSHLELQGSLSELSRLLHGTSRQSTAFVMGTLMLMSCRIRSLIRLRRTRAD